MAVLPPLCLSLYPHLQQRPPGALQVPEEAVRLTRLASGNQERQIEGTRQLLIALAQLPEAHAQDQAACGALFERMIKNYPSYSNFGVVSLDGQIWCNAISNNVPTNVAD